jgi:succinate dehydrogenase / fumarate reductase cytochrome b subunit
VKDVREALMIGRNSDGKLVRRPLSPHLMIYKPQLTTVLSIFHRFAGVGLAAGTLLMVWWLVAAATSAEAFGTVQDFLYSWIGRLMLLGWTVALFYHFFNGIRHLVWDAGGGFERESYVRSGLAVVAGTAVCTVLVWIAVLVGG